MTHPYKRLFVTAAISWPKYRLPLRTFPIMRTVELSGLAKSCLTLSIT